MTYSHACVCLVMCLLESPVNTLHMLELHIEQIISYSFKNFKITFKLHFKQKQHSMVNGILELICLTH